MDFVMGTRLLSPGIRRTALALSCVLAALAGAAPAHAKKKAEVRGLDVLVIDTGFHKFNEEASRLRTMTQVLAPGAEVRVLHYTNLAEGRIQAMGPRAVILAPSPDPWSRYPAKAVARAEEAIRSWRGPLLAIDGGHQLLARAWGGQIGEMEGKGEAGTVEVRVVKEDPLFEGLPLEFEAVTGHRDEVTTVPKDFVVLAEGSACKVQALRHAKRPIYGLQFRPEDPRGARLAARGIIRNFLVLARVARRPD